ncbi:MAG: hypothetical protein AB2728_07750 [Candidatus Thiodiazotropha sp.]
MPTLEELYSRAKDAHEKAQKRLLRIEEVKGIVTALWDDLSTSYEKDSVEWRIVDKTRSEHTDWWTVPTMSSYAKDLEVYNLYVIIKVIETITGKEPQPNNIVNKEVEALIDHQLNKITGRTKWDVFSELHRRYKLWFLIIVIALLLYLGWP